MIWQPGFAKMKCRNCGKNHSFFYRLKINYSSFKGSKYLPCKFCGFDLVDGAKVPFHFIVTGIIMVFLNYFDLNYIYKIPDIFVVYWGDLVIKCLILFAYFLIFPPIKKIGK